MSSLSINYISIMTEVLLLCIWVQTAFSQLLLEVYDDPYMDQCSTLRTENAIIWHCAEFLMIYNLTEATIVSETKQFSKRIQYPRIIQSENHQIILVRGQTIYIYDLTKPISQLDTTALSLNIDKTIDLTANIVYAKNQLFFKEEKKCNILITTLGPEIEVTDQDSIPLSILIDYTSSIPKCTLNFSIFDTTNFIYFDVYIKQIGTYRRLSYSPEAGIIESQAYLIAPSMFKYQFTQFSLMNFGNLSVLITQDPFSSINCVYLLSHEYLTIHGDYYYCGVDAIFDASFEYGKKMMSIYLPEFSTIRIVEIRKEVNGVSPAFKMLVIPIGNSFSSKSLRIRFISTNFKVNLSSHSAGAIKNFTHYYYCSNSSNIFVNQTSVPCNEPVMDANFNCTRFIENQNLIDLTRVPLSQCLKRFLEPFFKLCGCSTFDEVCKDCILQSLNATCLGIRKDFVCQDEDFPFIINDVCQKTTYQSEESYSVSIVPQGPSASTCFFVLDFGRFPREVFYSYNGPNNINDIMISSSVYDFTSKMLKKAQYNGISHIGDTLVHVNSIFTIFDVIGQPSQSYGSWLIVSISNVQSCLACLQLSHTRDYGSPNLKTWNIEESQCQSKVTTIDRRYVNDWYKCFYEEFSNSKMICVTKNYQDKKTLISFETQELNQSYPFCKVKIPLEGKQYASIEYKLKNYEDAYIEANGVYYSVREIIAARQSQISDVIPLGKITSAYLLYFTLDLSKTLTGGSSITINYVEPSTESGLNAPEIILLACITFSFVFCVYYCNPLRKGSIDLTDHPYEIALMVDGAPKFVKLEKRRIAALEKLGFKFSYQGNQVSLDNLECVICLYPIEVRQFRVFLCGRHFVHVDCFKNWYEDQVEKGTTDLCPLRCADILVCSEAHSNRFKKKKKGQDESFAGLNIRKNSRLTSSFNLEDSPQKLLHGLGSMDGPPLEELSPSKVQNESSYLELNLRQLSDTPFKGTFGSKHEVNLIPSLPQLKNQCSNHIQNNMRTYSDIDLGLERDRSQSQISLIIRSPEIKRHKSGTLAELDEFRLDDQSSYSLKEHGLKLKDSNDSDQADDNCENIIELPNPVLNK